MSGGVDFLLDDTLRRPDGQICGGAPDFSDGAVTLQANLAARALEQLFGLRAGALSGALLNAGRVLPALAALPLAWCAALLELLRRLLVCLGEAQLGLFTGVEAFLDSLLTFVKDAQERLVEEQAEEDEQQQEVDELGDERGRVEAERADSKKYRWHTAFPRQADGRSPPLLP